MTKFKIGQKVKVIKPGYQGAEHQDWYYYQGDTKEVSLGTQGTVKYVYDQGENTIVVALNDCKEWKFRPEEIQLIGSNKKLSKLKATLIGGK